MAKYSQIFIGLIILGLLSAYAWATWKFFTQPTPGGNDFLTHYGAWEAYIKNGYSPYSEEAALHTQQAIYGRQAFAGEDQNRMVYPFYSILLHGPFVWLDYELARAIYMVLLQVALLAGIGLMFIIVNWKPPVWLFACVAGWSLLDYHQARGIILGQFAIFGFFSIVCAIYLLKRGQDLGAGMILVLSTFKPTLVFLIVPFMLIWAGVRRRWNFIIGFTVLLTGLSLGSFLLLPGWFIEWLSRLVGYSSYTVGQSPVWVLTHIFRPQLGKVGEWLIDLLFLVCLAWTWWRSLKNSARDAFLWGLGMTIVIASWIVPRSATTNYVLMLIPIVGIFAALDRNSKFGKFIILIWIIISLVGVWGLHLGTVQGNQEQPIMFFPLPVVLILALLLGRRFLFQENLWNDFTFSGGRL